MAEEGVAVEIARLMALLCPFPVGDRVRAWTMAILENTVNRPGTASK